MGRSLQSPYFYGIGTLSLMGRISRNIVCISRRLSLDRLRGIANRLWIDQDDLFIAEMILRCNRMVCCIAINRNSLWAMRAAPIGTTRDAHRVGHVVFGQS